MVTVLSYLNELARFGSKPGLSRIQGALQRLGNPENRLKVVHVAGTNGKGSTCAMLASILQAAGYRTGLYTSPHLVRFNERIQINGEMISDQDLERYGQFVAEVAKEFEASGDPLTHFEFATALGFLYLAEKAVDVALIEVGLGGRMDATNVGDCVLSVITHISYDHTEVLGDTLEQIAGEKAGIIRPSRPVVVGPQQDEALAVLVRVAGERQAPLTYVSSDAVPKYSAAHNGMRLFWNDGFTIHLPLQGTYQAQNAAVARAAVQTLASNGWQIPEQAVVQGFETVQWPGRMEIVCKSPMLVLDGAHNLDGAQSLRASLDRFWPKSPVVYVLGLTGHKPVKDILAALYRPGSRFVFTAPAQSRGPAISPGTLQAAAKAIGAQAEAAENLRYALRKALMQLTPGGIVCICGSLYLVGEAKALLEKEERVQGAAHV